MKKIYIPLSVIAFILSIGVSNVFATEITSKTEEKPSVVTSIEKTLEINDFTTTFTRLASFQIRIQTATTRLSEKGINIKESQIAITKTAVALTEAKTLLDAYIQVVDSKNPILIKEAGEKVQKSLTIVRNSLLQSLLSLKDTLIETASA